MVYNTWNTQYGHIINEVDYDHDLHAFDVYAGVRLLGSIYPSTIDDADECFEKLDNGEDPVADGWEDGLGNSCSEDGWGMR